MESLQGEAGRVPTANLEAFRNLAWKASDRESLMEQFDWVRGIPQVPGGYYTWRNINNELAYKWEEFGLTSEPQKGE